ncbi:MAG: hypothetical protein GY942_14425 [Aestuariibacter sp.]|nr:hypothetical protein [Aestuariibacter sp.]
MTQIPNSPFLVMLFILISLMQIQPAAAQQTVRLEIRLRDSGGTATSASSAQAVTGETVILQRLPEETPILPTCTTGADGICIWYVQRGLYQVLFTQPLDDVSALALAEGGLRGFGITVGDAPITYHFTLQGDDRIYFDAAPNAARPIPIAPTFDALHGGTAPTPSIALTTTASSGVIELVPMDETTTPANSRPALSITDSELDGETAVDSSDNLIWQILVYIGLGLICGGAIYAWPKAARKGARIKQAHSARTPSAHSARTPSAGSGQVTQHSALPNKESDHA